MDDQHDSAAEQRLPTRTWVAARVGDGVAALSRRLGKGSGSVIGGRAILALDPHALAHLAVGRQFALVSGTNGKTTTTSLLTKAVACRGPVISNALGANLPSGIAAALAAAPPATGRAVIEVDEAWFGQVLTATRPLTAVLLNLSRDQLDRNNEVRTLSAKWRRALQGASSNLQVVANADDPLVAWAAQSGPAVTWVGAGQRWTADAAGCPNCGGRIRFLAQPRDNPTSAEAAAAGDGRAGWECSACDLRRPPLDVWLDNGDVVFAAGARVPLHLGLPGRCNQANAAMAMCAAGRFGVDPVEAAAAMGGATEVAGRYRTVSVEGIEARLLLAKNPAGWLEVFDLLRPPPAPVVVVINAQIADGRDPSWLWDVPFERLRGRLVLAAGERSADLAVRLRYADVEHRREPDPLRAIAQAGATAVDVVANYTSFQSIGRRIDRAA